MTTVELSIEHAGYTLAGTLHLPASDGPVPAVLMLHGSGAADRNSGDFLPPIRQAFLSRGLAVYSFDKRALASHPAIGATSRCSTRPHKQNA